MTGSGGHDEPVPTLRFRVFQRFSQGGPVFLCPPQLQRDLRPAVLEASDGGHLLLERGCIFPANHGGCHFKGKSTSGGQRILTTS